MITIIDCLSIAQRDPWCGSDPTLLELLDRPFLHHVVEYLIQAGSTRWIVLEPASSVHAHSLGTGQRWGAEIRYATSLSAALENLPAQPLLYVQPNSLVRCGELADLPAEGCLAFDHSTPGAIRPRWTGWALLDAEGTESLRSWDHQLRTPERAVLAVLQQAHRRDFETVLSIRSAEALLESQRSFLAGNFPELLPAARYAGDGVWMGRGASLHPDVHISGPVFIGEEARIQTGVHLGEFAVIGRHAVVGRDTEVFRSAILPHTWVGTLLRLRDSVVIGNELHHTELDVKLELDDKTLLDTTRL